MILSTLSRSLRKNGPKTKANATAMINDHHGNPKKKNPIVAIAKAKSVG
jgi:hypothetical protein